MIYTENTRKAMNIAYSAHNGQKDKSGVPYVFHPVHLAERMETEDECIVALLHDDSVPYMDYIRKIKTNPLAKKVKLADLEHNSDTTRLENSTEKDIKRWEKYREAKEILLS